MISTLSNVVMMVGAGSKYAGVASSLLGVLASGFLASHIDESILASIENRTLHGYKTVRERRERKSGLCWIMI